MRVIVALLLFCLAACAEPAGSGADADPTPTASASADDSAPADDDLLIELDPGDGTAPERYTLVCGETPDGDHPDPAAACAHLASLEDAFAALPTDAVCTEQYGGPQTARITGRWHGEPVELDLSRTDGCRISQWQSLGPVLPPVEGAVPN
jgi:hypothetical protein